MIYFRILLFSFLLIFGLNQRTWADGEFNCSDDFMQKYVKGNLNAKVSEKIFKFKNLRDDLFSEIEGDFNPDKVQCLNSFYKQAMTESGEFWGKRHLEASCQDSCQKEFEKSTAYLENLDKEFKSHLAKKIKEQETSRATPACAQKQSTDEIKKVKEEMCCGTASQKSGAVMGIYPEINHQTCLAKINPSTHSITSVSGIGECVQGLVTEAFKTIWNNISGMAKLPFELWSAKEHIYQLMTNSEARAAFANRIVEAAKKFVTDRVQSMTECLNEYEQSQFICNITGQIIGNFATPAAIGKLIQIGKMGLGAGSQALGQLLSETSQGQKILSSLERAKSGAKEIPASLNKMKSISAESIVQLNTKQIKALTDIKKYINQKESAYAEALRKATEKAKEKMVQLTERKSEKVIAGRSPKPEPSAPEPASGIKDPVPSSVAIKPNPTSIPDSPARAFLTENNLLPRHEFQTPQGKVTISDFFEDTQGRKFVVAQMSAETGLQNVVYYRSNSSAVFRELPSYHRKGWYDKGFDENALTARPELQQVLNHQLSKPNKEVLKLKEIEKLQGVIEVFDHQFDPKYLKFTESRRAQHSERSLTAEVERPHSDSVGRDFAKPNDVKIQGQGNAPNFKEPSMKYEFENSTYGKVKAEVYKSENGQIQYTVLKDEAGRIWFGDVGMTNSKLTSKGLRQDYINAKELTTPLWEYAQQIPKEYLSQKRNGSYMLNWRYVREIPEIQRYYKEKGIPIPNE